METRCRPRVRRGAPHGSLPLSSARTRGSVVWFFALVFVVGLPFWLLGALTGSELMPGLPIAALMAVCPAAAALIIELKGGGAVAASALLKRAFDFERVKSKVWYAPVLLLPAAVCAMTFGFLRVTGTPVPDPRIATG